MNSDERKLQLIKEILDGKKTQVEVAREVDLSRQAISLWVKEYRKRGDDSLRARRGRPKIKPLPRDIRDGLGATVRSQTPAEAGLDPSFQSWTYEAVRQLIIREAGVKLTYRFVAQYLDEWGVAQPHPAPITRPRTSPSPKAEPPSPIEDEADDAFSVSDYETALAEARSRLRPSGPPGHGQRTGRHARQRSAPAGKKKKRKSRRKKR